MRLLYLSLVFWVRILEGRNKRLGKGKKALVIVSILILLCALGFVSYKLFRVRDITVTGCETLSEEYVNSLSGLELEESIFYINTQDIMDAIDTEPYIKPVSVRIVYPDRVEITIEERKEAACIEKEKLLLIIDRECYLLKVLMQTDLVQYPSVLGLQMDEFQVGKRLGVKDTFKLDVLSRILSQSQESGIHLISIDVSLVANTVLETRDGFTVELGDDTDLKDKFSLVKASVQQLKNMGKNSGILDVAVVTSIYYREN